MESNSTKVYLVHNKDLNSSNSYCKQRSDLTASSRKLPKMTGCLEIIEGKEGGQSKIGQDSLNCSRPSSNTGTRPWSRGSISYFPPRTDSSMSRCMNTPTKQISLQAVRRKEESTEPFVDQVNWHSLVCENNRKVRESKTKTGYSEPTKQLVPADSFRLETVETSWQPTGQLLLKPRKVASEDTSQTEMFCDDSILGSALVCEISCEEKNRDEKNSDDGDDDDDSDSDSSGEEEEKLRAPNELLMEFVDCLMRKDYQTASKLCKMVLLYEPENPEALKFQPLIEEKLVLDAEAEAEAAEESSENDDSDDESEDGDDSSDDSEDDDDDDDGESCSDADRSDEDDDDDDK